MSLITITHTIGCDALGIARRVADGLTVEVYDDARLREEALRMGLHTEQLKGLLIRQSDNQKKGFFRYAFHKDWDDPTLYDLCVNPEKTGSDRAAQLIMEMARSPELESCSMYALDALGRMSQTKRIEATLMEMDLRHAGLRVEMPEKGVAHITGVLYNHEDKGRIPTVIGRIPGVEKVQLDNTLVPAGYD